MRYGCSDRAGERGGFEPTIRSRLGRCPRRRPRLGGRV